MRKLRRHSGSNHHGPSATIGDDASTTKELPGATRIHGHGANLLDPEVPFPTGFDAIWMSQFLDCFSEEEVTSILTRAARSMSRESRLYIMETFGTDKV